MCHVLGAVCTSVDTDAFIPTCLSNLLTITKIVCCHVTNRFTRAVQGGADHRWVERSGTWNGTKRSERSKRVPRFGGTCGTWGNVGGECTSATNEWSQILHLTLKQLLVPVASPFSTSSHTGCVIVPEQARMRAACSCYAPWPAA